MPGQTIALIGRVQDLVAAHADFFKAVREWYANVQLARKVVKLLLTRPAVGARVTLTVNGRLLAGDAVTVTPQARSLTWVLGPGVVAAGENEVAVFVEKTTGGPLSLQSATAAQEGLMPPQTVRLCRATPDPADYMELASCGEAYHRGDLWEMKAGGYLTFALRLRAPAPVTFSLALPGGDGDGWYDNLKAVLDDIKGRVEDKLKQLEEQRRRDGSADPVWAARLDAMIADLAAYLRLHGVQIEPAFTGGDGLTMQEVIRRTGDPDRLIAPYLTPPAARPVPAPPPLPPAPPGRFVPPRPPAPTARLAQRPAAKSSCASTCLVTLLVFALIIGGLVYAAYKYLIPAPSVKFDSLTEGQTVAAGAPLQVWVSGQDLFGVDSLTLSVEPGGADLVQGGANPAPLTFPDGTMDTGTKVFTLNLAPYAGPPRSIALVAVLKTKRGSFTARRVVQVGGTAQALVYEVNPPQPKPLQGVEVIIHAVNAPPGARVSYTLQGTDAYHLEGTLEVGPDGTVRYPVLGAANGVTDNLEARIEGTAVHQSGSYRFGD